MTDFYSAVVFPSLNLYNGSRRTLNRFRCGSEKKKKGPFEGKVFEDGCEIQRVIRYRNSFLPRIKGKFRSSGSGSELDFKMSLHPFVYAFMIVWLGFAGVFAIATVAVFFSNQNFEVFMQIPFILVIFGFVLTNLSFRFEAKIGKKELENIYSDVFVRTYRQNEQ